MQKDYTKYFPIINVEANRPKNYNGIIDALTGYSQMTQNVSNSYMTYICHAVDDKCNVYSSMVTNRIKESLYTRHLVDRINDLNPKFNVTKTMYRAITKSVTRYGLNSWLSINCLIMTKDWVALKELINLLINDFYCLDSTKALDAFNKILSKEFKLKFNKYKTANIIRHRWVKYIIASYKAEQKRLQAN